MTDWADAAAVTTGYTEPAAVTTEFADAAAVTTEWGGDFLFPTVSDESFELNFMWNADPSESSSPWDWEVAGSAAACWFWQETVYHTGAAAPGARFSTSTGPITMHQNIGILKDGVRAVVTFFACKTTGTVPSGTLTATASTPTGDLGHCDVAFDDLTTSWVEHSFSIQGDGGEVTITLTAEQDTLVGSIRVFVDDVSIKRCPFIDDEAVSTGWETP